MNPYGLSSQKEYYARRMIHGGGTISPYSNPWLYHRYSQLSVPWQSNLFAVWLPQVQTLIKPLKSNRKASVMKSGGLSLPSPPLPENVQRSMLLSARCITRGEATHKRAMPNSRTRFPCSVHVWDDTTPGIIPVDMNCSSKTSRLLNRDSVIQPFKNFVLKFPDQTVYICHTFMF